MKEEAVNTRALEKKPIPVTENLVKFFGLLLKVDKRLQEQKRKEMFS